MTVQPAAMLFPPSPASKRLCVCEIYKLHGCQHVWWRRSSTINPVVSVSAAWGNSTRASAPAPLNMAADDRGLKTRTGGARLRGNRAPCCSFHRRGWRSRRRSGGRSCCGGGAAARRMEEKNYLCRKLKEDFKIKASRNKLKDMNVTHII